MKIWYISKYANNQTIQGATRHFMLSKSFAKNNFDTTLIYSRSNGYFHNRSYGLYTITIEENVKCVQLNGPIVNFGYSLKRLFSWLLFEVNLFLFAITRKKKNRPDVIIASSLSLFTFITSYLLKVIFKCKLIVEVRDIWPETIINMGKISENGIVARILRSIEKLGYIKSDGIIATMPKFDQYLFDKYCIKKRFKCIPQGFDESWLEPSKLNPDIFDKDFFYVCHSGTIGRANYVEHLIEASNYLKNEKIKICIVGDGPLRKKCIEESKGNGNVIFFDALPKNEVIDFISNFDLLVNMWGDHEMYKYGISPYKWVDYMLAGVPVLVSFNGYRSIINEANCGFFIEANNPRLLADKILEISKMDKDYLRQLGMNGKRYALDNLSYDSLGMELLDFIKQC